MGNLVQCNLFGLKKYSSWNDVIHSPAIYFTVCHFAQYNNDIIYNEQICEDKIFVLLGLACGDEVSVSTVTVDDK